jgi:hypothetical protein
MTFIHALLTNVYILAHAGMSPHLGSDHGRTIRAHVSSVRPNFGSSGSLCTGEHQLVRIIQEGGDIVKQLCQWGACTVRKWV